MKKICRLILKCICVMLPALGLWLYTCLNPLGYMDGEAPYYLWNREFVNTESEREYQVIILGDSIANAAYVPAVLSSDTVNLSLGGITSVECYYILQDWLEHHTAPEVCYISFTDSHLEGEQVFWERIMYTHRLSLRQNLEILRAARVYQEPSVLAEHGMGDFISYELYLPNKYIASLLNSGLNQRYEENAAAKESARLHGGWYFGNVLKEYDNSGTFEFTEFHVNPMFDEYYRKILALCEEHHIQVRIVKPPLPYNKIYTESYAEDFNSYYEELKKDYPGLTVERFEPYNGNFFLDSSHLNAHGALRFSREVRALYPEDFEGAEVSSEQMEALNDSIQAENRVDQIIKWADGKDYTILISDSTGQFLPWYEETIQDSSFEYYPYPADSPENGAGVGFLSGQDRTGFTVLNEEDEQLLQLSGQEAEEWCRPVEDQLHLAVIDHYHNKIVCMKSFRYADGTFWLLW